jgi:hypothetical protein
MAEVVIAENINSSNEEPYKYIIEMIDIDTLLFNIMNTDTGINYKLYIKKDSEWCKENMYKIQNDFSQLYQIMNDCIFDDESDFRYELEQEKDMIKFKIKMKKDTKFFKLELDFELERYISDNGIIDDRLNSIEYQLNKLREGNITSKKITELEKKVCDIQLNINIIEVENIYRVFNECNNLIYKGEMKNGKRDGKGLEYCPNTGQILYDGNFKDGYYNGHGELYNKSTNQCITINEQQYWKGNFKCGLFDGLIEVYYYNNNADTGNNIGHYIARKDYYKNGYLIKGEIFNVNGTTNGIQEYTKSTQLSHNNSAVNIGIDLLNTHH